MGYKDKERQKRYVRQWIAKRRSEFMADKRCLLCGSRDNLEVHHRDKSVKVDHKVWSWSREKRDTELKKCDVLCHSCHAMTHKPERVRPVVHGTRSGYKKGCRCDACRDHQINRVANWKSRTGYRASVVLVAERSLGKGKVECSIHSRGSNFKPGVAQRNKSTTLRTCEVAGSNPAARSIL